MPVRIVDIANKLGVSRGTVDRALHGRGRIDEDMRDKIIRTAAEMNYHPNALARSLKTNRSGLVGLLMPSIMNSFFSEIIQGISEASSRANHAVVFCLIDDQASVDKYLSLLMEKRIDGAIVSPFSGLFDFKLFSQQLIDADIPVVSVTRPAGNADVPCVRADDFKGGCDATNHLIELGHSRIAYVSFMKNDYLADLRYQGYQRAMDSIGGQHSYIQADSTDHVDVKKLLDLPERPTAVFASSDVLAADMIRQLQNLGLRVPEDISVVGFDDLFVCTLMSPEITTIRQPKRELGLVAFEQLSKLTSGKRAGDLVLDVELIVRNSTSSVVQKGLKS